MYLYIQIKENMADGFEYLKLSFFFLTINHFSTVMFPYIDSKLAPVSITADC